MQDVKRWLNRGYKINGVIKALEESKQRAYELATSTTASVHTVKINGKVAALDKVQESHGNGTEIKMIACAEYEMQLEQHKNQLAAVLKEIHGAIMQVEDNTLQTLLIRRYLNFQTWESIAVAMNYNIRHVYKLHRQALIQIRALNDSI